jgi:hypothetical protein
VAHFAVRLGGPAQQLPAGPGTPPRADITCGPQLQRARDPPRAGRAARSARWPAASDCAALVQQLAIEAAGFNTPWLGLGGDTGQPVTARRALTLPR